MAGASALSREQATGRMRRTLSPGTIVFTRLLLLFTLVPVLELALLIMIGQRIGVLLTVALILATGLAGAWLARSEGTRTWREFHSTLGAGQLPGTALLHGLAILVGGSLLLTPGVLTDVLGLVLLIPPTRTAVLSRLRRRLEARLMHDPNRVEVKYWSREPPEEWGGDHLTK